MPGSRVASEKCPRVEASGSACGPGGGEWQLKNRMPGARKRTCPGSRFAREKRPCFFSEYVDASGLDFICFEHSDVVIVLVCFETGRAALQHTPTGQQATERSSDLCLFRCTGLGDTRVHGIRLRSDPHVVLKHCTRSCLFVLAACFFGCKKSR